nr:MAG TPA: hypothetical protein [Caudoviricetes sp.]
MLPYPSPAGFICVDRGNQHTSWRAGSDRLGVILRLPLCFSKCSV